MQNSRRSRRASLTDDNSTMTSGGDDGSGVDHHGLDEESWQNDDLAAGMNAAVHGCVAAKRVAQRVSDGRGWRTGHIFYCFDIDIK